MPTRNELVENTPRIGWFTDGLPDDVTPRTATLLRDDGRRITLTIPWQSEWGRSQIERWFSGEGISFGFSSDDPVPTHSMPLNLGFVDADGPVALIGCRATYYRSQFASVSIGEGDVQVNFAVFGTNSNKYDRIHGLRTELPALRTWFGLSSATTTVRFDDDNRGAEFTLSLKAPEPVSLSRRMNLRVSAQWRTEKPTPGQHTQHDEVWLETTVKQAKGWDSHLQLHTAIRDLIGVAAWRPLGFRKIRAKRDDDDQSPPGRQRREGRYFDVHTYVVRRHVGEPITHTPFLFTYEQVGHAGLERWMRLRKDFERGLVPLLGLLDLQDAHVETLLIQSSIGLEAIGYQLAVDAGASERAARNLNLQARLDLIRDAVPLEIVNDEWSGRAADAYNGVKHANRPLPDPLDAYNVSRENTLVFRCWAATRLGVSTAHLREAVQVDPTVRGLQAYGLGAPHK